MSPKVYLAIVGLLSLTLADSFKINEVHGREAKGKNECSIYNTQGEYCNLLGNSQLYRLIEGTTVLVESPAASGSGTIVSRNGNTYTVITAAHVVNGISKIEWGDYGVVDNTNNWNKIQSIEFDEKKDIALVTFTSDRKYPIAPIGNFQNETILGGKVGVFGYPLKIRGDGLTGLCKKAEFALGCFSGLTISKQKARELGLNSEFFGVEENELLPEFSPMLQSTRLNSKGNCRVYSYTKNSVYPTGYNISYDCVTYPGLSGGGVWDERTGTLIAIHGMGKGINTKYKGAPVTYKVGINMGITLNSVYDPELNSLKKTTRSEASDSLSSQFHQGAYFLENGNLASAKRTYKVIINENPIDIIRAAAYINLSVADLVREDLKSAKANLKEANNILGHINDRVGKSNSSALEEDFLWRFYTAYANAKIVYLNLQNKPLEAINVADNVNALYNSDISYNMMVPGWDIHYSDLNKLHSEILLGRDWKTGINRNSLFEAVEASNLNFSNSPLARDGALRNLEGWLKAIELHKHSTLPQEDKKKRICSKLAAATMNTYYLDPLSIYIDSSISSSAKEYCLGNGNNDFLNNEKVIPHMLLLAI